MRNPKRIPALLLALSLAFCLLAGCGEAEQGAAQPEEESTKYSTDEMTVESDVYTDAVTVAAAPLDVYLEDAPVPMVSPEILKPEASGTAVEKNDKAEIDYSNITDGYVMARFTAATDKRLKVQVAGPTTTYNYDLPAGSWVTYPLSDGNGSYKVMVLENTTGSKYAVVVSVTFQVTLKDEFAPFLRPNQYVDYEKAPNTVAKAAELTQGVDDPLAKVEKVYSFVVKTLTYDKEKAQTVKSGYLPVLDTVLAEKKGICFDYAALMAGMLRSQGVPCKLVVGYAGTAYHAWISVWTKENGWVDGAIYFDGSTWQRMDPTFASSGKQSASIMAYIGDGSHYSAKYFY